MGGQCVRRRAAGGGYRPGGVFAQLYGTNVLLEKDEQAMIKGMVINKFRGMSALLKPGLA